MRLDRREAATFLWLTRRLVLGRSEVVNGWQERIGTCYSLRRYRVPRTKGGVSLDALHWELEFSRRWKRAGQPEDSR